MIRIFSILQAGVFIACLLLSGCGGEPYAYEPAHELKPGPGLFSGKDGEFTLIGTPRDQGKEQAASEAGEKAEENN